MDLRSTRILVPVLLAGLAPAPALSREAGAMVERLKPPVEGVRRGQLLAPGREVVLGADGEITLFYPASCRRERVVGGTVTIGADRGTLAGGRFDPDPPPTVPCPALAARPGEGQVEVGAAVIRGVGSDTGEGQKRTHVVHGLSPAFAVDRPGRLVIVRLDDKAPAVVVQVRKGKVPADGVLDLAALGRTLKPDASYRATFDGGAVRFDTAPDAVPGDAPLPWRLLPFYRVPRSGGTLR